MRRAATSLLAACLLALPGGAVAGSASPSPIPAPPLRTCTGEWEPLLAPPGTIRGIATLPDGILAVGSLVRGQAVQMVARLRPSGWELAAPPAGPGGTLAGAAAAAGEAPWVAGSRVDVGSTAWIGRAVADAMGGHVAPASAVGGVIPGDSVPGPAAAAGRIATVLTAVDAWPGDAGVAVGYRHDRTGQRAFVVTWQGDGRTEPPIAREAAGGGPRESVLLAVVTDGPSRAWAAGWQDLGAGVRPLLVRGAAGGWQAVPFAYGPSDETVLTALHALPGDVLLVAGYRTDGARRSPFLVRRDPDGTLAEIPLPVTGGGVIRSIAGSGPDDLVVGGATFPVDVDTAALLLERDGVRWRAPIPDALADGGYVMALHHDPDGTLWAGGRVQGTGLVWRRCPAGTRAVAIPPPRRAGRSVPPAEAEGAGAAPGDRRATPRPAGSLRRAPGPAASRAPTTWVVRDIAAERGLASSMFTYGGVVRDFDGDGRDDIMIGTHAAPLRIFLARGKRFTPLDGPAFPRVDRHGCAAADVDASGLPDLFCTVGADRGLGAKRNELWIDPGRTGPAQDTAAIRGLVDPFGRGRSTAFLDLDGDGDQDLAVFADPTRQDGFPSRSRLYRNDDGRFTELPPGSIDPRSGGRCAVAADLDLDGRTDLVTCANIGAAEDAFLRIHRNQGGRLVAIPVPVAVRDVQVVGATVADLGGGPEPEIVLVDSGRVIVLARLARGGWRIASEQRVPGASAVAAGDADGDGSPDLYVVAGRSRGDVADLLLLNRGAGVSWEPVTVPPAPSGRGEAVLVIDPEEDGRDAFVVLNGQGSPGPVQLITIEPAVPGSVEAIP